MSDCIKCEHPREAHNLYGRHADYGDGVCLYYNCPCLGFRAEANEFNFDFCVSLPGYGGEDANEIAKGLMELVVQFVETFHGQVGGGFEEHKEEADDEAS